MVGTLGTLPAQDEPGPFERLFRALRHGFNESQHHSKSHNSSSHKQTAGSGNAEGSDDQSSVAHGTSGTSGTGVTRPPNEKNTKSTSRAVTKKGEDLPYGTPVAGKQGFVTSPFSPNTGYIDVRGFAPGTPVKDPYSGKVFLTP
jgi:hypothetical protein